MSKLEIKVPASIQDCSPQQLAKWLFLCSGDVQLDTLMNHLDFRVQVVSIFSGISKERLYNVSAIEIHEPFNHLIDLLCYETNDEFEPVFEHDGTRYLFDKRFEGKSTGQIIDLKLIESVYDDPIKVMAILFVEEGMTYAQADENGVVINPTRNRIKVFEEHFPGDLFLNVFAFFLNNYSELKTAIYILNMATTQNQMKKTMNQIQEEINQIRSGTTGRRTL